MLNPRLPILAGGVAILALALAQVFGGSDGVGFLFGWLLLVASLTLRRVVPFAWRVLRVKRLVPILPRLTVVAQTRRWISNVLSGAS